MMKRLTKKDRQELIEKIRQYEEGKVSRTSVGIKGSYWVWFELVHDHFGRLHRDLKRLGGYPILDQLVTEANTDFSEKEYAKHYDNGQIGLLLYAIKDAQKSLSWFESILVQERLSRATKKIKKRSRLIR